MKINCFRCLQSMHRMDLVTQYKSSAVLFYIINIIIRVMLRLINSSLIGFCCRLLPSHDVRNDCLNISKMDVREIKIVLSEIEFPIALISPNFNLKISGRWCAEERGSSAVRRSDLTSIWVSARLVCDPWAIHPQRLPRDLGLVCSWRIQPEVRQHGKN